MSSEIQPWYHGISGVANIQDSKSDEVNEQNTKVAFNVYAQICKTLPGRQAITPTSNRQNLWVPFADSYPYRRRFV